MNESIQIPDFGRILGPHLVDLTGPQRPNFLARLERLAAARYRAWAVEVPQWNDDLIECGIREDEIADRMMNTFPVADDVAENLEAKLVGAAVVYSSVFDGLRRRSRHTASHEAGE